MIDYTFEELYSRLPLELRENVEETKQSPEWHPEGNVNIHLKLVFEYAKNHFKDLNLMLCGIFHDLGKVDVTFHKIREDGSETWSAPGHENYTKGYIDKFISLYNDLDLNIEMIREVCKNHMRAHQYIDGTLKKPAKRKAFENLKYFEQIIKFAECDTNGKEKIQKG